MILQTIVNSKTGSIDVSTGFSGSIYDSCVLSRSDHTVFVTNCKRLNETTK